jgi:MarR family
MDKASISAAQAAAHLQTSVPRVVRAARRLAPNARQSNGRYAFTEADFARLRARLGVSPSFSGLSSTEAKALAALDRAPLGLRSARAVAERAGVSPTAASRALQSLHDRGLAHTRTTTITAGHPRRATIWHANRLDPLWSRLSPGLARVAPPTNADPPAARVPPRLRHLFWNTAESQLALAHGGPYIARRLLRTLDLEGLAWGAANLAAADWREAAQARGLAASVKALAENLAVAAEAP